MRGVDGVMEGSLSCEDTYDLMGRNRDRSVGREGTAGAVSMENEEETGALVGAVELGRLCEMDLWGFEIVLPPLSLSLCRMNVEGGRGFEGMILRGFIRALIDIAVRPLPDIRGGA